MALIARLREIGRDVVWIRRALIILQVAGHARRTRQIVVVVDMTIRTEPWRHGVQSAQGKSSAGVIEFAVGPEHGVVAILARSREMRSDVVDRIGCRVVVVLVATHAGGGGDVVVVVNVAIRALSRRHRMRAHQRESGGVVVEGRIQPAAGAVALIAGLGEIRSNVTWVRSALEILQVAGHASRAGQVVVVVDVAIHALPRRHGV